MSRKVAAKNDDGKKKKQQAASLARRMAGKKGQTTQLQIEVNNEEDWEKLLTREGVIIIDVYSEWSGPCLGMIANLKKAKVDYGGDTILLAIAKNDEIECLSRFRNRSEPTWLFSTGGTLSNGMFGANAPKLMKMIDAEVRKEMRVLKGETFRAGMQFTELFEEEKDRQRILEKLRADAEKLEAERKAREIEEKRTKLYNAMGEQLVYETVVICFPHTIHPESGCVLLQDLEGFFRTRKMYIANQAKVVITKEMFDEIFFLGGLEPSDDLFEDLESGPCLALLLKSQLVVPPGQEGEKKLGDIERPFCASLNLVRVERGQEAVVPGPHSIPAKSPYIKKLREEGEEEEVDEEGGIEVVTSVPGCWTPASYVTKCAAIRYLFPARAEKVMPAEEAEAAPRIVIAFDTSKQKECFELMEEYPEEVLNYGYFSSADPSTAEPLCATPEQYAKLQHFETDRLIFVVSEAKSEPLLSFAGLGAVHVSLDRKAGDVEADLLFPPGVEPVYPRLEEAERMALLLGESEEPEEEEEAAEEEEEPEEQDEEDLMALLGVTV